MANTTNRRRRPGGGSAGLEADAESLARAANARHDALVAACERFLKALRCPENHDAAAVMAECGSEVRQALFLAREGRPA